MISTFDAIFLTLQCAFAIGLFLCCFTRLALTDQETYVEIRAALVFKATSAATVFFAPFAPLFEPLPWPAYHTPEIVWLMVLLASLLMQWTTGKHWNNGTPRAFTKPEHRAMRRAADFKDTTSC